MSNTAPATRKVTLSERKQYNLGREYLDTFVGLRAVHTDWTGTQRVGTLEYDTRNGQLYPGHFLLVRFDDGKFARCGRTLQIVK